MLILYLVVPLVLSGIALFVLFDLIVYREHEEHTADWERDKSPSGFFWQPSDTSSWQGSNSRSSLASSLIFKTPNWVLDDQKASRLLFWYRLCWWITMGGWLALVIKMIASPA
jgi:hypothetical protein